MDDTPKTEQLVEKYDVEARYRKFKPGSFWAMVITIIAVAMSLFQLYVAIWPLEAVKQRAVHLAFALVLVFLLYPSHRKSCKEKPTISDFLLVVLGASIGLYIFFFYDQIALRGGVPVFWDYIMAALAIPVLLEAGRRSIGWELPGLALVFLFYNYFGQYLPDSLGGHSGFSLNRILEHLYLSSEGIFGTALGVSATYIFLFILFGAFLGETGMSKFINDISLAIAGRAPGGPAKVAVFASGLMGTISGSAVANVATTGAFTIPLMKNIGYKPHFAGAVEAVASTGGQVMPPIMGAAAFIMAEFLNIPYSKIMIAGIVPALLYYLGAYVVVHLEAVKTGLKGLPKELIPDWRTVLKEKGHLIVPLFIIIYLIVSGMTPAYAAVIGIIAAIIVSSLRRSTRMSLAGLIHALEFGARGSLGVIMACAVVGFIIGTASLTSLGIKLGDSLLTLANGHLWLGVILAAIVSIILGMGMPTTAVYIVGATMMAPALIKMGAMPLAAHFFVFYFGNISNVTPPVALAAFTGAGIAQASPSKVGWTAVRLALSGFIIPFMFLFNTQLLLQGEQAIDITWSVLTAIIGVIALSSGIQGWLQGPLRKWEQGLMIAASLLLIKPGLVTDAIGFLLVGYMFLRKKLFKGAGKAEADITS